MKKQVIKAKLMLQSLLAERFQLKIHTDSRPMAALVLTLGKGKPKLKEAEGKGFGCQNPPDQAPPQPGAIPKITLLCRNMTMEAFSPTLRAIAGGTKLVVDKTGLEGAWDFDITLTPPGMLGAGGRPWHFRLRCRRQATQATWPFRTRLLRSTPPEKWSRFAKQVWRLRRQHRTIGV